MSEEKISAAIMAYNEEINIPDLMQSLEGVDEVVIVDNGSTDDTVKLARELGATVYEAGKTLMEKYSPTKDDIAKFEEIFGWAPTFTEDMKFGDYSEVRNFAISLTENEWVLNIDCDERIEWLLPQLKHILPEFDVISFPCVYSELEVLIRQALFRKSKMHYIGWYHEFVMPFSQDDVIKSVTIQDGVRLTHHPRPRKYRKRALSILEFSVITAPNFRTLYYLGREYGSNDEHEKALKALDLLIESEASDYATINEAWVLKGLSQNHLGDVNQARYSWLRALERNPNYKDPLNLLSITSKYPVHQERWNSFAELATGEGALFSRAKEVWKVVEEDEKEDQE